MDIVKLNALSVRILCEKDVAHEISETFSFFVPDFRFMPSYKHGTWDGMIRLFSTKTHVFPIGLLGDLIRWARTKEIPIKLDRTLSLIKFDNLEDWVQKKIPKLEIDPYDYQLKTFIRCIQNNRALVLSPTGSGKSFIIYLIIRFLLQHIEGKVLISVPSTNLVRQMHVDFCDYEQDSMICDQCYEMAASRPKETEKRIVIATWSMLLRRDPEFFQQFDVFICDECVHPDSMITMSDGSQKPIKEIKEGDWVKSLNETTHQIEDKVVEKVHTNLNRSSLEKRFKISLENGTDLIVTGNHKVMTKRGWIEVKLLTEDDEILTNVG